ncbi:MAG: hypothetical protein ACM3JB_04100, partial [Acidobacteriaceae bacterium]
MANRAQLRWRLAKTLVLCCTLLICWLTPEGQQSPAQRTNELLTSLRSPVLFQGDATTGYRDPAAAYHDGWFYLYFTLARTESPGGVFLYVALSKSRDLVTWTEPKILTPRDKNLNFSSPGNVVRIGDEWILCLQSYPRPAGERYGTNAARLWIMRSKDLEHWGAPELLRVKGPEVPPEKMGRMIDPFLVEDKDEPGKWWCLYKQHGMSRSWSRDLKTWRFAGSSHAGENACVVRQGTEYALFTSPGNGISVKKSVDLKN